MRGAGPWPVPPAGRYRAGAPRRRRSRPPADPSPARRSSASASPVGAPSAAVAGPPSPSPPRPGCVARRHRRPAGRAGGPRARRTGSPAGTCGPAPVGPVGARTAARGPDRRWPPCPTGPDQPGDHVEQRGLARPVGSDEADDLARRRPRRLTSSRAWRPAEADRDVLDGERRSPAGPMRGGGADRRSSLDGRPPAPTGSRRVRSPVAKPAEAAGGPADDEMAVQQSRAAVLDGGEEPPRLLGQPDGAQSEQGGRQVRRPSSPRRGC